MNKYCIQVKKTIEVENVNEIEVFKKMDHITREVLGYYIVTKSKEYYQIDEKTYRKIREDKTPDFRKMIMK
ncbi:hypothetical protein [Anaerosporobacter faecicola]|uniref:hypothetical protein n=1 Tax=Anaerosporobacter faecicola TaxID=2718714 RepID=UPI001439CA77|nr:hypothetical protein [Anaerosporobacter faecicola]